MENEIKMIMGLALLVSALLFGVFIDSSSVKADGNVTVRLNITNTEPYLFQLVVDDVTLSPTDQIDLTANNVTEILCNASISDPNGYSDIASGLSYARIFDNQASSWDDTSDNNYHYRNNSCNECYTVSGASNNASCICRFNVQYYANNASWTCMMNITDAGGTALESLALNLSSNLSDDTLINELLALTIPITELDYGNLTVTQTSDQKIINVTNAGNTQTNFTVRGFGGQNESHNGNLSMICESGNISIGYQRFSNMSGMAWDDMANLTWNNTKVTNITLLQRTDDTAPQFGQDLNLTYWRIRVPLGPSGLCNGTIVFSATNA